MKNKKTIIIIASIIITYLIFAIIFFGLDNLISKFQSMKIVFSTGDKWQLKDGKWENIDNQNEYDWNKFIVYVDNELLGDYNLLYNKKWYIYDNKKSLIKYDGNILGISGNKKYEVIDFQESIFDTAGENILKDILEEENIDYPKEFTYAKKVTLDIDDDKKEEDIYTVSNAFTYETNTNKKFSIVFINDDKLQVIYERYEELDRQYDLCVPKVNSIIDFNKDSKYEIITECNYYSDMGTCTSLYELEDGKYKLIKGC